MNKETLCSNSEHTFPRAFSRLAGSYLRLVMKQTYYSKSGSVSLRNWHDSVEFCPYDIPIKLIEKASDYALSYCRNRLDAEVDIHVYYCSSFDLRSFAGSALYGRGDNARYISQLSHQDGKTITWLAEVREHTNE